jgi:hypothetical protein
MAISYYPNKIRVFPVHQNLTDDILAEHMNNVQAELFGVMAALGTPPHVYNDLQTDGVPTEAIPDDDGGIIDNDTFYTGNLRFWDPKVKPIDHGTVGQRLDDIERGKQNHAFQLVANTLPIASSNTALDRRPSAVRFPKPALTDHDPFELHNGVGVTLRKAGFWAFAGTVAYTLLGSTAGSNNGVYQATIDYDGEFVDGMDRDQLSGSDKTPILQPVLFGFFRSGTQISLRTSQNSGRGQRVRRARLTGICLRETIEV